MPLQDLLTPNRVHLLAGYRDAGKTSFILPAMVDWRAAGGPPWAYVSADRVQADTHSTITRMGYQISQIPIIYASGLHHKSFFMAVNVLRQMSPPPEVVVIEAFQYMAESINKHQLVDVFLQEVFGYLDPSRDFPTGLTILGICGGTKRAKRDKYPDPTQRVPGCATWVERASTIILIEASEKDPEMLTGNRMLYACSKQGLRIKIGGVFDANKRLAFPTL